MTCCYHCPDKPATRKIRNVEMCLECYAIALEHCADWQFRNLEKEQYDYSYLTSARRRIPIPGE